LVNIIAVKEIRQEPHARLRIPAAREGGGLRDAGSAGFRVSLALRDVRKAHEMEDPMGELEAAVAENTEAVADSGATRSDCLPMRRLTLSKRKIRRLGRSSESQREMLAIRAAQVLGKVGQAKVCRIDRRDARGNERKELGMKNHLIGRPVIGCLFLAREQVLRRQAGARVGKVDLGGLVGREARAAALFGRRT
jgi:hypothetical protein